MSDAKNRLLSEAREEITRTLIPLVGKNDLDEAFAAWLLGPVENRFRIEGPLREALANGRRTARGVAILGYAAATQKISFNNAPELSDALNWISGRPVTVAGSPASFTSDPLAILGIALGIQHANDSTLTAEVSAWMARFLPDSCSRPSVQPWELCLYSASRRLSNISGKAQTPSDNASADIRVVLRSRGLLPPVQQATSDADEATALTLMLEPIDMLSSAQRILRVAAFDSIKEGASHTKGTLKLTVPAQASEDDDSPPTLPTTLGPIQMSGDRRDKVFISYSWDSAAHQEQVVALANSLLDNGLTTHMDAFISGTPAEGFPNWMLNQIRWADFVLCVCTETYRKRCEGEEEPGKGKGAKWEGGIITRTLYDLACPPKSGPVLMGIV
jgi:hypothetical protein